MSASTTFGPIAVSSGTIALTGSIFGLGYETLIAGFFGGFIALGFMQSTTRKQAASAMLASAFLAGFVTPVVSVVAVRHLPELSFVSMEYVQNACAFLLGAGTHTMVPVFLRTLQAVGNRFTPGDRS